jgi:hypothetical protein
MGTPVLVFPLVLMKFVEAFLRYFQPKDFSILRSVLRSVLDAARRRAVGGSSGVLFLLLLCSGGLPWPCSPRTYLIQTRRNCCKPM